MKPQKWDSLSLLRLEKSADSLLKMSNNIIFAFISLFIFIPLISIMKIYFEGSSSSPETFKMHLRACHYGKE